MKSDISRLIYRNIIGKITDEEKKILSQWSESDPENARLLTLLSDHEYLGKERLHRRKIDSRRPWRDMQRRVNIQKFKKFSFAACAAAAITGIIWGVAAYLHTGGGLTPRPVPAAVAEVTVDSIRPGRQIAELVTRSGVAVTLDSLDVSAMPKSISSTMTENVCDRLPDDMCLDVPRGGEFKIVLSDSTVVWLNSDSQLRFPETFTAYERRVKVSGEAYFEVKKDSERPFYVESKGQEVRVYGTKFNVKAYADEEAIYTTLESGSISLRKTDGNGGELYLVPGHQAVFDNSTKEVELKNVNAEVISAWRHGRFVFEERPLSSIMRELSRWYDFEYEFTDQKLGDIVFMGSMTRDTDIRKVLSILEASGEIKIYINNKKLVVSRRW